MAVDPICGMDVAESSPLVCDRDGTRYWFCCAHCLKKFQQGAPIRHTQSRSAPEGPVLVTLDLTPTASPTIVHDSNGTSPASTTRGETCCGGASTAHAPTAASGNWRYICPMCPGVGSQVPAACPICGMDLELADPTAELGSTVYRCPQHPQEVFAEPGLCAQCGAPREAVAGGAASGMDEARAMARRLTWALAGTAPLMLVSMGPMLGWRLPAFLTHGDAALWLQAVLCGFVMFIPGWPLMSRAGQSLRAGQGNMFTLIGLGTWITYGASVASILAGSRLPADFRAHGHAPVYFESAAMIIALVLLGQVLELTARHRTGGALRALMQLTPPRARRIGAHGAEEIPIDAVRVNDLVQVIPGERVPVDGVVVEGSSYVDESMLTGEAEPVLKQTGAQVTGGTWNQHGTLTFRVEHVGRDTILSQIIQQVAAAQRSRAPIQQLADRVASYFVPAVIGAALAASCLWIIFGEGPTRWLAGLIHGVSVLVIACPCAIGLATPMSIVVAMGRAAQAGILIKDARVLQDLRGVDVLLLDKTGTLTEGRPRVVEFGSLAPGVAPLEMLRLAAAAEQASEHPLGGAIVARAREAQLEIPPVTDFTAQVGGGVVARWNGQRLLVGRFPFLTSEGITLPPSLTSEIATLQSAGCTLVGVAHDSVCIGWIALQDPLRPTAAAAVAELQRDGVHVVMLTGDQRQAAQVVADAVGIREIQAEVSPHEKWRAVQAWQARGKKVAMAGDGINDAPALVAADVGIAMGTGTQVAIASADVTLVRGTLDGIRKTLRLSRATMANIRQNLFLAFVYNGLGIPLAAGLLVPWLGSAWRLNPMWAAAAMSGSSLSVILNALRLRRVKLTDHHRSR